MNVTRLARLSNLETLILLTWKVGWLPAPQEDTAEKCGLSLPTRPVRYLIHRKRI